MLRIAARLFGRSLAPSVVCTAIMPQPMSTPTAAGITAAIVGITLPTVAPIPRCTSGIAATQPCTIGKRAMFESCSIASPSTGTPRVQVLIGSAPGTSRSS